MADSGKGGFGKFQRESGGRAWASLHKEIERPFRIVLYLQKRGGAQIAQMPEGKKNGVQFLGQEQNGGRRRRQGTENKFLCGC